MNSSGWRNRQLINIAINSVPDAQLRFEFNSKLFICNCDMACRGACLQSPKYLIRIVLLHYILHFIYVVCFFINYFQIVRDVENNNVSVGDFQQLQLLFTYYDHMHTRLKERNLVSKVSSSNEQYFCTFFHGFYRT